MKAQNRFQIRIHLQQRKFYIITLRNFLIRDVFVVWLGLIFAAGQLYSQQYSQEEVISAYIFNFVQNIEWPDEKGINMFHFKVITGNKTMIEELEKMCLKKKVRNKYAEIIAEERLTGIDGIQLVFVTRDKEGLIPGIFDKIEGKNILLISDTYPNKRIVMINFIQTKDQTIKFEINKANIINQELKVLPEMVLLGGSEIDVAKLYKESQNTLRIKEEQIATLQLHLDSLNVRIKTSNKEIDKQRLLVRQQAQNILQQQNQMKDQQYELYQLLADVKSKHDTLFKQAKLLNNSRLLLKQQQSEIDSGKAVLSRQQIKIDSQNTAILLQEKVLKKQGATIKTQKYILYLLILIALLAIGLSYTIFWWYKSKQRSNRKLQEQKNKLEVTLKELKASKNKAQQYLDVASVLLIALDTDHKITLINQKGCAILGYPQAEIIGQDWYENFIPENIRPEALQEFQQLISGEISNEYFEKPVINKDGEERLIAWYTTLLRNESGKITGTLSSGEDITERKHVEKQIEKLNMDLLYRATALEAANKELESFAYSVSHDLRAPLRSIDGFSYLLLEKRQENMDNEDKNYLERIRSAAQRMAQLIDDLLSLSRVTRSEMNIQEVDLSKIAWGIAQNLQESQPERQVNFIISDSITAKGDARLLRIVLENLFGNAWKYTSKHSIAQIEFGLQQNNAELIYFIRDDGAGFDMNYANKLFGAFQRLHDSTEFPGTGIGLATVGRIIQRHGGKVWAQGEVEKGATFYFSLPYS